MLTLRIRTPDGTSRRQFSTEHGTVEDIRALVQSQWGVPPGDQQLSLSERGNPLQVPNDTLLRALDLRYAHTLSSLEFSFLPPSLLTIVTTTQERILCVCELEEGGAFCP